MNNPTILLTGATGFLGSHLLEALLKQGYSVVVLKRSTSNLWRIEHLAGQYTSYNLEETALDVVFTEQKIDIVVHLATLYRKFDTVSDVVAMMDANVRFPTELLVQGVKNGILGFINTGTFFEYDCLHQPVDENAPISPFNFYARTKLTFETMLKSFSDSCVINTFRLFSPFGEKDNPKLVPMIIEKALKNEVINLSEGLQKIDLIYAQDIIAAYICSINRILQLTTKAEYEVFNLGSGSALSIRDVVSLIEQQLGKRIDINWGASSATDISIAYASVKKAKELLGWMPSVGVQKGLENTVLYHRNTLEVGK